MPHIELKYSNDLDINTSQLFDTIEQIINENDSSAGECKSRAYPAELFKHTHLLITIWLLPKTHRDQEFSQKLLRSIKTGLRHCLPKQCFLSLELVYRDNNYVTENLTQT